MGDYAQLNTPCLTARRFGARSLPVLTDDALFDRTGVRIAFTGREGGVSQAPFDSLNLGGHVGDNARDVQRNRELLLQALSAADMPLVMANQVHGSNVVQVDAASPQGLEQSRRQALDGADGLIVTQANVAALLCFADCVPVIIVSPTGRFAVVHAGWRGVDARIAPQAVRQLAALDAAQLPYDAAGAYNVYLGPHIHAECFQTGPDVHRRFVDGFGCSVALDDTHISLAQALSQSLQEAGVQPQRIAVAPFCTQCNPQQFFSYRASGGTCGRHGALALRFER